MILLPEALRRRLRANADLRHDSPPPLKLFNPIGPACWLASELEPDGDTLFGLADLGFGCPELGSFSLREIARVRLPFGLAIERDRLFEPRAPLSVYAEAARHVGGIVEDEAALAAARTRLNLRR